MHGCSACTSYPCSACGGLELWATTWVLRAEFKFSILGRVAGALNSWGISLAPWLFCLFYFWFLLETGSHYIALVGLECAMKSRLTPTHRDMCTSISQVLRLKKYVTRTSFLSKWSNNFYFNSYLLTLPLY